MNWRPTLGMKFLHDQYFSFSCRLYYAIVMMTHWTRYKDVRHSENGTEAFLAMFHRLGFPLREANTIMD